MGHQISLAVIFYVKALKFVKGLTNGRNIVSLKSMGFGVSTSWAKSTSATYQLGGLEQAVQFL